MNNRDQKLLQLAQFGVDLCTAYIVVRRVVAHVQVMRAKPAIVTPSSAMG